MTTPRAALSAKLEQELAAGNFRIILLNNPGGFTDTELDMAQWLQYEPIQSTGGYAPQAWTYTAGSATYNSGTSALETPEASAQFTASGTGYAFTHVALWQGRGAVSAKTIESINTSTNYITVTGHGLVNGDRAFITSTGTRPGTSSGEVAIQNYYVGRIDADTIALATNAGLSSVVDFTSTGSGTISLRYSNGSIWHYEASSGTVNPGSPKNLTFVYRKSN